MKQLKPIHWIFIALGVILLIVGLILIFKPKTQLLPGYSPPPPPPLGQSPKWYESLIGTLGPGLSNWIFGSGGGGTSSGGGCQQGVVTGSNPCIDDCGFPISSDINPACV